MNRRMFSLILIIGFIVLLAGCAPTVQPQPQPPTPTTYTIKVISGCQLCYGNVYINGVPSGAYLLPYGAANISGVPSGAAIRLEDELGWVSHTEYFYPPYTNISFNYF